MAGTDDSKSSFSGESKFSYVSSYTNFSLSVSRLETYYRSSEPLFEMGNLLDDLEPPLA